MAKLQRARRHDQQSLLAQLRRRGREQHLAQGSRLRLQLVFAGGIRAWLRQQPVKFRSGCFDFGARRQAVTF